MPTVEITATTTKGKSVKITVDMESETVEDLKHKICAKINGLDETDVKIVYRAKPLFDEQVPLAKAGVRAGGTVTVIAQARHLGGAPRAAGQALKEVMRQVKEAKKAKLHNVQDIDHDEDNPLIVNVLLKGAVKTPFSGCQLSMTMEFPTGYPYEPPIIVFNHELFHPNIWPKTNILCWNDNDSTGSQYNLEAIIGAVNTLMQVPNPDSPANNKAAALYLRDSDAWFRQAREAAKTAFWEV